MITLTGISHSFAGKQIFKDLNWNIKDNIKYGLVGPNGTGKTTLLEAIYGLLQTEKGQINLPKDIITGYLPQETGKLAGENTIVEEALKGLKERGLPDDVNIENLSYRAEKILMGLGFSVNQLNNRVSTLSGGWKMRVELAKILLKEPDVLLLDEPTNHLDIRSIEWVENYLGSFGGTVVLVSHDKYLLDRMVDTIAELDNGIISEYNGNYSKYVQEKERLREIQEATWKNQQKKIKQTERFIERFRYKNTKAKQVQSRIKMLEKMNTADAPESENRSIKLNFPESRRSGKIVYELSEFSKQYSNANGDIKTVFDHAGPLVIERGDKIALAGRNGQGKTTLAKIIVGAEESSGRAKLGYNVELSYFAQDQTDSLNYRNTVFEEVLEAAPILSYTQIRSILGSFLFDDHDVEKKISVLSGGEKSRVALSKMLVSPSNFLVMDEPTNHLDIRSREILLEALGNYTGAMVVISHDRYFIDQLVNKVWYVEDGGVETYLGTYSRFIEKYNELHPLDNNGKNSTGSGTGKNDREKQKTIEAEERKRLSRELQEKGLENMDNWRELTDNQLSRAVEELERKIMELETEKEEYQKIFNEPDFFDDVEKSGRKTREFDGLNKRLDVMYKRWDEIAEYNSD